MALLGVYYETSHDSLVGLRGSGVNFKRTDVGMRGNRGKGINPYFYPRRHMILALKT